MRLYKAQYVTSDADDVSIYDEWDEETSHDWPEPEGWREHSVELWGCYRRFFPPSDRPIYRSRSAAQRRVDLINRWLGEGAAILLETETEWLPIREANRRRWRARVDKKVARLEAEIARVKEAETA